MSSSMNMLLMAWDADCIYKTADGNKVYVRKITPMQSVIFYCTSEDIPIPFPENMTVYDCQTRETTVVFPNNHLPLSTLMDYVLMIDGKRTVKLSSTSTHTTYLL